MEISREEYYKRFPEKRIIKKEYFDKGFYKRKPITKKQKKYIELQKLRNSLPITEVYRPSFEPEGCLMSNEELLEIRNSLSLKNKKIEEIEESDL